MELDMEIKGLEQLEKALDEFANEFEGAGPKEAKAVVRTALRKAVTPAKSSIIALTPVDTGELKDHVKISIKAPTKKQMRTGHFRDSTFLAAWVGYIWDAGDNGMFQKAVFNEYGSKNNPKHAPIERTFNSQIENIVNKFEEEAIPAITKIGNKLLKKRGIK